MQNNPMPQSIVPWLQKLDKEIQALKTRETGTIYVDSTQQIVSVDPQTGVKTIFGNLGDRTGLQQWVGDTEPPAVPTMPYVIYSLGGYAVTWDGLFEGNAPKTPDFDHCKVYGTNGTIVAQIGTLKNTNDTAHYTDNIVYGESWSFWLTSVDANGNESEGGFLSPEIVATPLVDETDISEAINAVEQAAKDAETAAAQATAAANLASKTLEDAKQAALAAIGAEPGKGGVISSVSAPTDPIYLDGNWLWLNEGVAKIDHDGDPNTPSIPPPFIYDGTNWIQSADPAVIDAAAEVVRQSGLAQQAFDKAVSAAEIAGNAQESANSKNTIWYETPPVDGDHKVGDTWFDAANDNIIKVWDGSAWVTKRDQLLNRVQDTANDAQSTAEGKSATYWSATEPLGTTAKPLVIGDTWFDTDNNYALHTYTGTQWLSTQDMAKAIETAATDATTKANNAKQAAIDAAAKDAAAKDAIIKQEALEEAASTAQAKADAAREAAIQASQGSAGRSSSALVDRIAFNSGAVSWTAFEDDTKIFVNGELSVDQISAGQRAQITLMAGDKVSTTKPVVFVDNNVQHPWPISFADVRFIISAEDRAPIRLLVYATQDDAEVTATRDDGVVWTFTAPSGQFTNYDLVGDTLSGVIRVETTSPILLGRKSVSGERPTMVPPMAHAVIGVRDRTLNWDESASSGTLNTQIPNTSIFYCTNRDTRIAVAAYADGAGVGYEFGAPWSMVGDRYIIPHHVSDYAIATIESEVDVRAEYWDDATSTWILHKVHSLAGATSDAPIGHEEGSQAGTTGVLAGTTGVPWRFYGTGKFFLRTNSVINKEYTVYGYDSRYRTEITDGQATEAQYLARLAHTAAGDAQDTADSALKAATHAGINFFDTGLPSGVAPKDSIWFQYDAVSNNIVGQWQQIDGDVDTDGSNWQKREVASEVIANLDVGKLTGGFIDAGHIQTESLVIGGTTLGSKVDNYDTTATTVNGITDASGNVVATKVSGTLAETNIPTLAQSKVTGLPTIATDLSTTKTTVEGFTDASGNVLATAITGTLSDTVIPVLAQSKVSGLSTIKNDADTAMTRITSWTYTGTTTINGGAIQTDTISVGKLDATIIDGGFIKADLIQTSALVIGTTTLGAKVDTYDQTTTTVGGITDVNGNVVATKVSGTLAETNIPTLAQSKVSGLNTIATQASNANALTANWVYPNTTVIDGGAIHANTIDVNHLDSTIIEAGYLKSILIDAEVITSKIVESTELIDAKDIIASGTITSASGVISNLDAGVITSGVIGAQYIRIGAATDFETAFLPMSENMYASTSIASGATGSWYRIASNTGNRAYARFILKDTTSGKHGTAVFEAGITFGRVPFINLVNFSEYGSASFTKARIVYMGTYDPPYVEVFIPNAGTNLGLEFWITENVQDGGWNAVDWQPVSEIPAGYTTIEQNLNPTEVTTYKASGAWNWRTPNTTTIDGGNITTNTIHANRIMSNTITALEIASQTISADEIASNAITTAKLEAGAITSKHTITGATIQTEAAVDRGIKLHGDAFDAYNSSGEQFFNLSPSGLTMNGPIVTGGTITGGTFRTSGEGAGVIWSDAGIEVYDTDGSAIVGLPSDGSPAQIDGELIARSLTVLGSMAIRGQNNEISSGALFKIAAGVSAPVSPPMVSMTYPTVRSPEPPENGASIHGLVYFNSHWWRAINVWSSTNDRIEAIDSNGVISATISFTGGGPIYGLTHLNGVFYVLYKRPDGGVWVRGLDAFGNTVNNWRYSEFGTGTHLPAIGTDGTRILIAQCWSNGNTTWRKYSTTGTFISRIDADYPLFSDLVSIIEDDADYGANRVTITKTNGTSEVYLPDGTHIPYDGWYSRDREDHAGMCWDGTRFHGITPSGRIITYSNIWDLGDDTNDWWISNAWVDDQGRKTTVSPSTRFTLIRRAFLNINHAVLPMGAVSSQYYLERKSTKPSPNEMHSFANSTNSSVTIGNIVLPLIGAAPPLTNQIPDAQPGWLQSQRGTFQVDGMGSGSWGPMLFSADGTMSVHGDEIWPDTPRNGIVFANGWTNYSTTYGPLTIQKTGPGMVAMTGMLQVGVLANDTKIANITDPRMRPTKKQYLPATLNENGPSNYYAALITIEPNGDIRQRGIPSEAASNAYLSISVNYTLY